MHLSEQFTVGDTLVVYNLMFPRSSGDDRPGPRVGATAGPLPLQEGPCPSCTALLDSSTERCGIWRTASISS